MNIATRIKASWRFTAMVAASLFLVLPHLAADAQKTGGVLRVGISADVQLTDPHLSFTVVDRYLIDNVYEGLTALRPSNMAAIPALAVSWKAESPTSYLFTLRPNVKFHNGQTMTSEDVKYSIDRVLDVKVGSRLRSEFTPIDSVTTAGDRLVRIKLKTTFGALVPALSALKIVPKGSGDDLKTKPIGTGPFMVTERVTNQRIVLSKFKTYWNAKLPYLDQVVLLPIPDATVRLANLTTGQVQLVDSVPPASLSTLKRNTGINLYEVKSSTTYDYFAFNLRRPLLQNTKLRQAMAWALDKEAIVQAAMEGAATVALTPFPTTHWAYKTPSGAYRYDLVRAKKLLAEAGYPNGGVTVSVAVSPSYPEQVKMAEIWQESLRQIGVNLKLDSMEWSAWLNKVVTQRDYDIFISYSSPLLLDPNSFLYYLYYTGGSLNINAYSNPKMDALLDQGLRETNATKRKVFYAQVQKMLTDEVPRIIIDHRQLTIASTASVEGFVTNFRGDMVFSGVSLK